MCQLRLLFRDLPVYSLAAQQNAYRLFSNARLIYAENGEGESNPTLHNVKVRLTPQIDALKPEEWDISSIAPGQYVSLQERMLRFSHDFLMGLSDETTVRFDITVTAAEQSDAPVISESAELTILPANFWGGETRQPELLAAFVKPNGVYVESLVKQVTEVLERSGHGRSADGYQSNTREKPYAMAAALWSVIAAQKIAYVSPPPSFAQHGQLVRLTSDISTSKMGACLDLSLLFASCLELMGLNTVIALTREHAVVGVWLVDTMFPLLTNDDPMELRKRVDASDLVLFETTMVTGSPAPTFLQACQQARSLIEEEREDDFVYAIDIAQARSRKIKPLATVEDRPDETESDKNTELSLPPIPPLPPVRAEERVIEETPQTRIDAWQRKLLDLTKRNPLLSFKDRTAGIRIFCPDISQLEDQLADGDTFSFVSAEKSPVNERERSVEAFRLATGNDLHEQYALEQLAKKQLIANMGVSKLDSTSVSLFRKAKNDLEEGGANTLFLALGMLAWRENPEDTRVYKAPLILIPVELVRKSASAPVKLRQLADEEPLFNLTLIEFLKTEYAINIEHLREDLPEDASGIDVRQIWQDVREAVAEQRGFEVVEECVVASFSFAKYLMWRDLRDRLSDLKQNPFVSHMADTPDQAYQQDASFLLRDQLDEKIDPTDIFIPLNCDSSQMVAVEASSRPQDFVLEGPPGTGKSETIANIIANNLAKGRKVLFVAEKIAALQVVYRRLEKIGLDHLALELHSNKANKKAVLDQLRRVTELSAQRTAEDWIHAANLLRDRRDALNKFVIELHEPSSFGISPRSAIARLAAFEGRQKVRFDWGPHLSDCPLVGEAGFEGLRNVAKTAGIAYGDVSHLDTTLFRVVTAVSWSNAWQSNVMSGIREAIPVIEETMPVVQQFAEHFNVSLPKPTASNIEQLRALAELVDIAQSQSIAFAIGPDVRNRLDRLTELADRKASLDERLKSIAHGASAPRLHETPVDEWIALFEEASQSFWKKLFIKGKLNKLARSAGYGKFNELEILYALRDAKKMVVEVDGLAQEFSEHQIWKGWDAQPDELRSKEVSGRKIHQLIKQAIGIADEPMDLMTVVKAKLLDGREFLEGSKLTSDSMNFTAVVERWEKAFEALATHGVIIDSSLSLSTHREQLDAVKNNERSLKPWVEWVAARGQLDRLSITPVAQALEAGQILPSEAEEQAITGFCAWLAPCLIDDREKLRQFKASEHNQKLEEFRQLDAEVAKTTSAYIAATVAKSTPDIRSKEHTPHFGTLARELQKKTRHKPIRALFEDMGERLLELTPCLMMSPLSVAQFLPSSFSAFDLVVFDEASQITTWDSVGAIARGKNVIVVGDPKQMPPTNFFSASVDPDDPDEEDMESILDQALAAGLPHLRLMGHYRSRHETLIAFSNNKYYENALVTYPSSDTKESAVVLHRVDGVYAKGTGRNNPIEAKAVVQEVVKRLLSPRTNNLSLGIVTLNTEQQRTIEDLLDDARRGYPEIERFFQATDDYDPVFVKNLESVQGDERDVIMFSLGYGPTAQGGKTMSMNFGPLNKQGGERRLNVAITRATTEVVVFSSFDSSMIDLSRTSATAVEHLKHYLEFAEKGPIALAEQSTATYGVDQFDSDFEQAVAFALRDRGWHVQTQVGVSKFRVDLGVVHPDYPGRYLAGVECDGATYHSSPNARDRDRTRHAILEHLGWRLVRLWSTDYFQNPTAAIQSVHERLDQIQQEDRRNANVEQLDSIADIEVDLDSLPAATASTDDGAAMDDEQLAGPLDGAEFSADVYFEPSHEPNLVTMAKQVLEERPCITLKSMALEIANRHGKNKTSSKQLSHLTQLIDGWAGVLRLDGHDPVYWLAPNQIVTVTEWRGLAPFGYERTWREIAYPEALGLALEALKRQPSDPVDYICNCFELKRRASSTIATFQEWLRGAQQLEQSRG